MMTVDEMLRIARGEEPPASEAPILTVDEMLRIAREGTGKTLMTAPESQPVVPAAVPAPAAAPLAQSAPVEQPQAWWDTNTGFMGNVWAPFVADALGSLNSTAVAGPGTIMAQAGAVGNAIPNEVVAPRMRMLGLSEEDIANRAPENNPLTQAAKWLLDAANSNKQALGRWEQGYTGGRRSLTGDVFGGAGSQLGFLLGDVLLSQIPGGLLLGEGLEALSNAGEEMMAAQEAGQYDQGLSTSRGVFGEKLLRGYALDKALGLFSPLTKKITNPAARRVAGVLGQAANETIDKTFDQTNERTADRTRQQGGGILDYLSNMFQEYKGIPQDFQDVALPTFLSTVLTGGLGAGLQGHLERREAKRQEAREQERQSALERAVGLARQFDEAQRAAEDRQALLDEEDDALAQTVDMTQAAGDRAVAAAQEAQELPTEPAPRVTNYYSMRDGIDAIKTDEGKKNASNVRVVFARVTPEQADAIHEATGENVDRNYTHTIDGGYIFHILSRHGEGQEKLEHQSPVTEADLEMLPEIVAAPDHIGPGGKTKQGFDTIAFSKRIDGHILVLEAIKSPQKKKTLVVTAIRKVKAGYDFDFSTSELLGKKEITGSPELTSDNGSQVRVERPDAPGVEQTIPQTSEAVKERGVSRVRTAAGTEAETRFRVMEAEDLIASNTETGAVNDAYPQELQPRQRDREASQAQIGRMAANLDPELLGESRLASDGAPIIGPDRVVESGNGRVLAIRQAYKNGKAENYRRWLAENAGRFGLDAAEIEGMKNPVLVRERQGEIDRAQFAREASVARMSPAEQAMADAERITQDMLTNFDPERGIAGNREFVQEFARRVVGENEMGGFVQGDGRLSQEGLQRIANALFAKAYGDSAGLARMRESLDDNIKNVSGGMLQAAPRLAVLEEGIARGGYRPELSLAKDAAAAANTLARLRNEGTPVRAYLGQGALFTDAELSPEARRLLEFFDENKRSAKKIAAALTKYAELAMGEGSPNQGTLFEDAKRGKKELLKEALRYAADPEGFGQGTLFDENGEAPEVLTPEKAPEEGETQTAQAEAQEPEAQKPEAQEAPKKQEARPQERPQAPRRETRAEQVKRIQEDLKQALLSLGHKEYGPGEAEANAKLITKMAEYYADYCGMDLDEVMRRLGIGFVSGGTAAETETYAQARALQRLGAQAEARLAADEKAWRKLVDRFNSPEGLSSGKRGKLLPVMQTPLVFNLVGMDSLPVEIRPDVMMKILVRKHKLSAETIKQIPRAITDPIMIFNGEHDTPESNSRRILTELKERDSSGKERSIIAVFKLDKKNKKQGYEINELVSIYRNDTTSKQQFTPDEDVLDWIDRKYKDGTPMNMLRYVNRDKASKWAESIGTTPASRPDFFGDRFKSIPNETDLAKLRNQPGNETLYQRAWTGSRNVYENFDPEMIGSGVGTQWQGWGFYFASRRDIANWYRVINSRTRKGTVDISRDPTFNGKKFKDIDWGKVCPGYDSEYVAKVARNVVDSFKAGMEYRRRMDPFNKGKHALSWVDTLHFMDELIHEAITENTHNTALDDEAVKQLSDFFYENFELPMRGEKTKGGQLVEAEIPDSDVLLDWDKKLAEQPEKVKKSLGQVAKEIGIKGFNEDWTGEQLYKKLAVHMGGDLDSFQTRSNRNDRNKETSLLLDKHGIKGIQYLDERSDNGIGAHSSHNFVIFDAKAIQVYETYRQLLGERGAGRLDAADAGNRIENLGVARQMEEAGKDAKAIRLATGWERGADGKWRFEVLDGEVSLEGFDKEVLAERDRLKQRLDELEHGTDEWFQVFEQIGDLPIERVDTESQHIELQDIYDAPELYKAYPQLKYANVRFEEISDGAAGRYRSLPGRDEIVIDKSYTDKNLKEPLKRVLIHEIQHIIQGEEGFAPGGNIETAGMAAAKRYSALSSQIEELQGQRQALPNAAEIERGYDEDISALDALPEEEVAAYDAMTEEIAALEKQRQSMRGMNNFDAYKRLMGETEARDAEARMDMSAEERRNTLLRETEDVAWEDQILLRDALGKSEAREAAPTPPPLDETAGRYVLETGGSINIPLDRLRVTEVINEEGLARAKKNMDEAERGTREKRAPLSVVARGDGTYTILDGNNTYTALKEMGAKSVPVEVTTPYHKGVTGLKSLYAKNAAAEAEFHALMRDLQKELGGRLEERDKMKSKGRILEKVRDDYAGDFSRVVDVWGGTLVYPSHEEVLAAFEKLKDRFEVIRIKDKWNNPDPVGYRDFNANLRLSDGTIVELQLQYDPLYAMKNWIGHLLYEFGRRNKNSDEMVPYIEQANEISRTIYAAGFEGRGLNQEANSYAQALEIGRRLSNQTSARASETLLNDLSGLILNILEPFSSESTAPEGRNSTANGTSSPFSKYRSTETTSNGNVGNETYSHNIASEGGEIKGNTTFEETDLRGTSNFAPLAHTTATISLFQAADASTFLHELWHVGLDDLLTFGRMEGASEQAKADVKTAMEWLGITEADLENSDRMREAHEKWAEAGEQYFMNGHAPSPALLGVFQRFRKWLLELYNGIRGQVELSPEIQGVFDRILAANEEITEAYEAQTTAAELEAEPFFEF